MMDADRAIRSSPKAAKTAKTEQPLSEIRVPLQRTAVMNTNCSLSRGCA
jgi:hypothetical protein